MMYPARNIHFLY